MKLKTAAILTKMVDQFKTAHEGKAPTEIVVEPVALVALGLKKSVAPMWQGVKVTCREMERREVVKPGQGTALAVLLDTKTNQIVSADLIL